MANVQILKQKFQCPCDVIPVLPFLSSQCSLSCHPSAPFLVIPVLDTGMALLHRYL
ncbi:hypothetical protein [Wolbachia endosymbiont (group A) of Beris morrisii]|uniref:hypothetical protein n=1 Tax=Wolbachia endosymbiont (group A) of Beris morrisii TaxID=3066139 RepID=UPI00334257ED